MQHTFVNSTKRIPEHTRMVLTALMLSVLFLIGVVFLVISEKYVTVDPWGTLLNVTGGFLSISVMTSFLYRTLIQPQDDVTRLNEIRTLIDEKMGQLISGTVSYGLQSFQHDLKFAELFDTLQQGDELWWLDTYAPGQKLWIEHLRESIKRGARVRMLVLNPDCANVDYRADEIGGFFRRDAFKEELRIFSNDIIECINQSSAEEGKLEIRWYSGLLCVPMYVVTRNGKLIYGYTSFFLCRPTGVDFPHLRWTPSPGGLLDHFYDYITKKWDHAEADRPF